MQDSDGQFLAGQVAGEDGAGPAQAGLHGSDGDLQHVGDFVVRPFLQVRKHDDDAERGLEFGECGFDEPAGLGGSAEGVGADGGTSGIFHADEIVVSGGETVFGAEVAVVVDDNVAGEEAQPGSEGDLIAPECMESREDTEEDVLREVACVTITRVVAAAE